MKVHHIISLLAFIAINSDHANGNPFFGLGRLFRKECSKITNQKRCEKNSLCQWVEGEGSEGSGCFDDSAQCAKRSVEECEKGGFCQLVQKRRFLIFGKKTVCRPKTPDSTPPPVPEAPALAAPTTDAPEKQSVSDAGTSAPAPEPGPAPPPSAAPASTSSDAGSDIPNGPEYYNGEQ